MSHTVDYYLAPQSPWTYLGHERFARMAAAAGAPLRVLPVDMGKVFAVSGGLPLGKRAPQRQAYRLVELRRFSEDLGLPLNLHPKFFPVAGHDAARLMIAVGLHDGSDAMMRVAGAIFRAVWVQERNIDDAQTLAAVLDEQGVAPQRLAQSREPQVQQRYDANTQQAIEAGVFGAPTYVVDGEMFWGQDRLQFVQRRLQV